MTWSTLATAGSPSSEERGSTSSTMPACMGLSLGCPRLCMSVCVLHQIGLQWQYMLSKPAKCIWDIRARARGRSCSTRSTSRREQSSPL